MIPKRAAVEFLLGYDNVKLVVAGSGPGLVLPPDLLTQAEDHGVTLEIGLNMPIPILDLHLDDDGFVATLSFRQTPFKCVVPWAAVIIVGIVDEAQFVWAGREQRPLPASVNTPAKPKRGLSVVS
jgi:hypothetical protein